MTSHVLRQPFATHMFEAGANIRLVQELLGHRDVSATEIYTHVMDKNVRRIESPIEWLDLEAGNKRV